MISRRKATIGTSKATIGGCKMKIGVCKCSLNDCKFNVDKCKCGKGSVQTDYRTQLLTTQVHRFPPTFPQIQQMITFAVKFSHHGLEMWYCRFAERW